MGFDSRQRESLGNLKKVLELSGSSLEKVVKYNVFLKDMDEMASESPHPVFEVVSPC